MSESEEEPLVVDDGVTPGVGRNVRNGTRNKTVISDTVGAIEIEVSRDRESSFSPVIVKKRQRRLTGIDEIILSLYARGMTTGDIAAHFEEIYGVAVSKETISRITDKVVDEMHEWSHRSLNEVYAAIFIDAIIVKIRDGQVVNRPIYAAIGVTCEGKWKIFLVYGQVRGVKE